MPNRFPSAGTEAGICNLPMLQRQATLAQNPMLVAVFVLPL